ncbi:transglycosylase domain-containing protein [Dactylosporangium sp. NPDC000521]|uniref:transglycosylase domain-containing protein n=1 Tax=Dactylosporangium sp. NPDC000521 TaxID=3363975 RepID=UPI0036BBD053
MDDDLSSERPAPRTPDVAGAPEGAGDSSEVAGAPEAADRAPGAARTPEAADKGAAKGRRRRWRKVLLRSALVLVLIAGLGLAGGTYYYDNVAMPEDIAMDRTTTIYYADGTTPMARIGDVNRTLVAIEDIPVDVQHAFVAAQDPSFYSNSGVDYWEAAGAVWNHVAGDGKHGGSTISQQYARRWADLEGTSFARKAREAVIATKLNQQYTKDQILVQYLNIMYFGRGAYGLQAAGQAYFGKAAKELTAAEGAVLAALIDNPEGDGSGSPFDPTVDERRAHERFDEIKRQMVDLGFVKPAEADQKMAFPAKVLTAAQARANAVHVSGGLSAPEGLIVHHVLGEVAALTDPRTGRLLYEGTAPDGKKHFDRIRNGGLKIVTTVDKTAQEIAVREAGRNAGSNMDKQPANLQAALVAIEPGTGAVKAYYGGDSGNGGDYAGFYADPVLGDGADSCCGGHPAGASFDVYTLAAGLAAGYSIDSFWNGESPQEFPGRGRTLRNNNPVRNAGENPAAAPACKSGSPKWCTLDEATVLALNTPYFALADAAGPAKVIDTARAAGIASMWTYAGDRYQRIDLTKTPGNDAFPKYFNTEVGFGQYPVTVLDHAAGMATFANRGIATKTHFLKEVWTDGKKTFAEVVRPVRIPGFTEAMADDLSTVLQGVPQRYGLRTHDDRQLAGAAGAWQLAQTGDNANAWMAGYTASDPAKKSAGLAVAVWVGNKAQEQKIVDRDGKPIIGGTLPGAIWRDFLDGALTALNVPVATFPPATHTGDKLLGTGVKP